MHTYPKLPYNGLTIVLSNPSRFDTKALLSGWAGDFLWQKLQGVNRLATFVTDIQDYQPLPNTRIIFALGSKAMQAFFPFDNTLNQQRGYIYENQGILHLCSYAPQDAMDMQDYEARLNPKAKGEGEDDLPKEESESEVKSTKGRTGRSNFRFWLEQDCKRAAKLLRSGEVYFQRPQPAEFSINPPVSITIKWLLSCKGGRLYLDIETEPKSFNWWCISLMSSHEIGKIYTLPILRYNYTWAYSKEDLAKLFAALAIAFQSNTVVVHNIFFDLFVLAWRYRIAFGRSNFDTMLAHARLYPGTEKSLGHCMSTYTYEPYHKSEGVFSPKNEEQEIQLWRYNAKDVWGLYLVEQGILQNASVEARQSIEQVSASIYPYLLMSLMGIRYLPSRVHKILRENDARMEQMLRMIRLLVGYNLLPSSPKQLVKYFHTELGFPTVGVSKITGKPSLSKDNLYKLHIKQNHPVIPLCLEFRELMKESGSLKFEPWNMLEHLEEQ